MFEKRFSQMRVFRRKSFILIHRIIKHLNQTMKFQLQSETKPCTCFLTKVTIIFKELLEKIRRMDRQLIMLSRFFLIIVLLTFWIEHDLSVLLPPEKPPLNKTEVTKLLNWN